MPRRKRVRLEGNEIEKKVKKPVFKEVVLGFDNDKQSVKVGPKVNDVVVREQLFDSTTVEEKLGARSVADVIEWFNMLLESTVHSRIWLKYEHGYEHTDVTLWGERAEGEDEFVKRKKMEKKEREHKKQSKEKERRKDLEAFEKLKKKLGK